MLSVDTMEGPVMWCYIMGRYLYNNQLTLSHVQQTVIQSQVFVFT